MSQETSPGDAGIQTGTLDKGIVRPADRDPIAVDGEMPDGQPGWIDADAVSYDGRYKVEDYWPHHAYRDDTVYFVNNGAYSIDVSVYDSSGDIQNSFRLHTDSWGSVEQASNHDEIKVEVVGSIEDPTLKIDVHDAGGYEIWMSGAVLTSSFWVGNQ